MLSRALRAATRAINAANTLSLKNNNNVTTSNGGKARTMAPSRSEKATDGAETVTCKTKTGRGVGASRKEKATDVPKQKETSRSGTRRAKQHCRVGENNGDESLNNHGKERAKQSNPGTTVLIIIIICDSTGYDNDGVVVE